MQRLENRTDIDFIVVADHGMSDLTNNVTNVIYLNDYLWKDSFLLRGFELVEPINNYTIDELWRNLTKLNDSGLAEIYRFV